MGGAGDLGIKAVDARGARSVAVFGVAIARVKLQGRWSCCVPSFSSVRVLPSWPQPDTEVSLSLSLTSLESRESFFRSAHTLGLLLALRQFLANTTITFQTHYETIIGKKTWRAHSLSIFAVPLCVCEHPFSYITLWC